MLKIPQSEYDALRAHGEETYPHECCGVLLGRFEENDRVVERVVRCTNTRTDRGEDRYNIDPAELVRVQRKGRASDLDIVGFYHSHPDHPAQWSQTDFNEAHWIGCSYVITSVPQRKATVTNSFLLTGEVEETKRFEDEEIRVGEPVPAARTS
jgi:proteasome lid subunit RPN8/RPN11